VSRIEQRPQDCPVRNIVTIRTELQGKAGSIMSGRSSSANSMWGGATETRKQHRAKHRPGLVDTCSTTASTFDGSKRHLAVMHWVFHKFSDNFYIKYCHFNRPISLKHTVCVLIETKCLCPYHKGAVGSGDIAPSSQPER
jgi:hypothetical protein